MAHRDRTPLGELSRLGVFRGATAVRVGISRDQLTGLCRSGVIERTLPDTYRMTAIPESDELRLRAALSWGGDTAAGAGPSAGRIYGLEGVRAAKPEIVVPRSCRLRSEHVVVHHSDDTAALMIRTHRGFKVTGIEATLLALATSLESEAL